MERYNHQKEAGKEEVGGRTTSQGRGRSVSAEVILRRQGRLISFCLLQFARNAAKKATRTADLLYAL